MCDEDENMSKPVLIIVSHNNAREGAPRLCSKLAVEMHNRDEFRKVYLCALSRGATPEPMIQVIDYTTLFTISKACQSSGSKVIIVLSTVVSVRIADRLKRDVPHASIVGLIHEVRNETFKWVKPEHFYGVDKLVYVANYTADSYPVEFAPGLKRNVIHNWLSDKEKEAIDVPKLNPRKPEVLCVGVVAKHKGQLHVARAFAEVAKKFPEYRLKLVGHVYEPEYAAEIKKCDPERIELLGSVEHDKVIDMMRHCSVFVHGSPMESCCLSVMEAMYSGCAIVATRVGGITEQITDGFDGFLYDFGDANTCAMLMERLMLNVPVRESIGNKARETVIDRFSKNDKIDSYIRILL